MPYLLTTGLDGRVIGMTLFVAIALAGAFGLGPAVLITKDRTRAGDVRMTLAHGDRKVRRVWSLRKSRSRWCCWSHRVSSS